MKAWGPSVRRADPQGLVSDRSAFLCAALGALSQSCHRALGGHSRPLEVRHAGAALSLLTKVDDQVIDALAFHGGADTPRATVERRVRAHLAPTLDAIWRAQPTDSHPRTALAAALGQTLRRLAAGNHGRLDHLLNVISEGWEIQVQAVAAFSRHPNDVERQDIERITASISGLWLLMITMIGTLPPDAHRTLTPDEERAFTDWGAWIQRADARADLDKDLQDGLISSLPGHALSELEPNLCAASDPRALYALLAKHEIDAAFMPSSAQLDALQRRVQGLGEIPTLLRWIHGFLTWRYLRHPLCQRASDDPRFARHTTHRADWRAYVHSVALYNGTAPTPEGSCLAH